MLKFRLIFFSVVLLCITTISTAESVYLTDKTIFQSVSDGESVFMLTPDGVLSYSEKMGVQAYSSVFVVTDVTMYDYLKMEGAERERVETGITHILMGSDGLWGINAYAGLVGRIDAEGVHFAEVSFDTSTWFNGVDCPINTYINAFAEDDTIYIQLADGLQVWCVDMAKTFKVSIPAAVFQCIPYGPHQALLNIQASAEGWSSALYTLDLDTWQVKPLNIEMPEVTSSSNGVSITRLAWHQEEQRLVIQVRGNGFAEDGLICQSVSGDPLVKLSILYAAGTMHLISNGTLLWIQDGEAISYALTQLQNTAQTTLEMKGLLHQDISMYQSYLAQNPHINLLRSVSDLTEQDVEALVNRSKTVDVFALYANQLYQSIIRKGYALPLVEQGIDAAVKTMYPIFQPLLMDDLDRIVAMPTKVSVKLSFVDQELWNATFGQEMAYPRTYQELFQLMIIWEENYAEEYPDVNVTDDWSIFTLFSRMLDQYVLAYEESDKPLSFDDEVFMKTMDAFMNLKKVINQDRFEHNALLGNKTLFSTCNLANLFHMTGDTVILPPLQMGEEQTAIRVDVVVLLGNDSTQSPEYVTSLIAHLSQMDSLSVETKYALYTTFDQPAIYMQGKTEYKLTQEGIQAYRDMLPFFRLSATSRYLSQSDSEALFAVSVQPLIRQLLSDTITQEQFCRQINRISTMMWEE